MGDPFVLIAVAAAVVVLVLVAAWTRRHGRGGAAHPHSMERLDSTVSNMFDIRSAGRKQAPGVQEEDAPEHWGARKDR